MLTRFQILRFRALVNALDKVPSDRPPTYEERSWTYSLNLMFMNKQPGDKVRVRGTW